MLEGIVAILVLAAVVEGVIAYVLPVNQSETPREWVKYVSAALGVVICVAYHADILAMLGIVSPFPFVGSVITGLLVGRGSNFLNDFYTRVKFPMPNVVVEEK